MGYEVFLHQRERSRGRNASSEGCAAVDIKDVLDELQVRDVAAPVLLRFPDILDNRVEKISRCFRLAADEYGYEAKNFHYLSHQGKSDAAGS